MEDRNNLNTGALSGLVCRILYSLFLLGILGNDWVLAQPNSLGTLRAEANSGSIEARLKLAECFALGLDCPENQDSLLYYLKPLLKISNPDACFLVGNTYLRSGTRTISDGLRYLEMAAEKGMVQAVLVLLEVYSGKDAKGPFANSALAAKKNDPSLFRIASKASTLKEPVSAFYLGMCYLEGRGTLPNDSLALHWLSYSATWGYCPAQLVMGDIWFRAKTAQGYNLTKALDYYSAAKENYKCTIEQKGGGIEGEAWVERCFSMLWNSTWEATCLLWDHRIELLVPEVKEKDFQKNRFP